MHTMSFSHSKGKLKFLVAQRRTHFLIFNAGIKNFMAYIKNFTIPLCTNEDRFSNNKLCRVYKSDHKNTASPIKTQWYSIKSFFKVRL